jgi:exosortase/archaeosortase family protein
MSRPVGTSCSRALLRGRHSEAQGHGHVWQKAQGQAVTAGALPGRHGQRPSHHRRAPAGRTGPSRSGPGHSRASHSRSARAGASRSGPERALRLAASLLCAGLAVIVFRESTLIRGFEAWLASHVIALGTGAYTGALPARALVWFASGKQFAIALQVTSECTVALLMIPFLLLTAWLVWLKNPLIWPMTALATAVTMLIAVNQLRILTIVWFILGLGEQRGFYWGHTVVGTLITIFGLLVTFCVFIMMALRRGRARAA